MVRRDLTIQEEHAALHRAFEESVAVALAAAYLKGHRDATNGIDFVTGVESALDSGMFHRLVADIEKDTRQNLKNYTDTDYDSICVASATAFKLEMMEE